MHTHTTAFLFRFSMRIDNISMLTKRSKSTPNSTKRGIPWVMLLAAKKIALSMVKNPIIWENKVFLVIISIAPIKNVAREIVKTKAPNVMPAVTIF